MRKRNIKTVAHWVIMSILLLFPILMVGVSSFANDEQSVTVTETYEYETNDVETVDDLVFGNIYKYSFKYSLQENYDLTIYCQEIYLQGVFKVKDFDFNEIWLFRDYSSDLTTHDLNLCNGVFEYYEDITFYFTFGYYETSGQDEDYFINNISASDYLGEVTTNVDIQNASYKQEVNNWCNGFKNLPVNQWYGQLLNVIGVGQTTNSVMNVIYVYPLYVLWVYLIDLIVDCLLVIIHFGHNALSRLGGDND